MVKTALWLAALATFQLGCLAPAQGQVTRWVSADEASGLMPDAADFSELRGSEVRHIGSIDGYLLPTPPVASETTPTADFDPNLAAEDLIDGPIVNGQYVPEAASCDCDGGCDACAKNRYGKYEVNPVLSGIGCNLANRLWGVGCCKASCKEGALAHEWLPNSPLVIEQAQPLPHVGLKIVTAYNQEFPDRAEYFWAQSPGSGPNFAGVGERSVDYQDFRFKIEVGGKKFSVATDIPIRVIDPVLNRNTAGFGDMKLTSKVVLFEGSEWMLTQVFNTNFNTGSRTHGTGTGHISLEPGLLSRWAWSESTYFHGEITYLFPLGADPNFSGQILKYGLGVTHILYDGDAFGILPSLEFVGWSVLDGQETLPNVVLTQEVDGIGILNAYPGVRFVFDSPGDWAVWDLGIAGGFALTNERWYDGMLMANLRWIY